MARADETTSSAMLQARIVSCRLYRSRCPVARPLEILLLTLAVFRYTSLTCKMQERRLP